jgi:AcrR family transcriptional regulator
MSAEAALERSAKRRAELVLAAYELFVGKGYRNVAVADIVARVGVSHGTFYNYFDNKRGILDAVIDHYYTLIAERVIGPDIEPSTTLDEFCVMFGRAVDRCFDLVESEPGLVNFILLEAASIDDRVIHRSVENMAAYGNKAMERVENGIARGFLDPELDSRIAGEVMLSVILSALLSAMRGDADGLTQEQVNTQLTAFIRGAFAAES